MECLMLCKYMLIERVCSRKHHSCIADERKSRCSFANKIEALGTEVPSSLEGIYAWHVQPIQNSKSSDDDELANSSRLRSPNREREVQQKIKG